MLKERFFISILLLFIGILSAVDIVEDLMDGKYFGHIVLDLLIALSTLAAVAYLAVQVMKERRRSQILSSEKKILEQLSHKLEQRSKVFIDGFGMMIDREFEDWNLSPAEREVALFLLKGLSSHEIAEYRNSSEKTVRHQMTAIYKKSSLKNRSELQAYFLEDILAPSNKQMVNEQV